MNTRILSAIAAVLLVLPTLCAHAQDYSGVAIGLTIDNGQGRTQTLTLGVRETATSGLDQLFGETELPPLPPVEIFDARLVSTPGKSQLGTGSWIDLRPITSQTDDFPCTYTLSYQAGQGSSGITISWGDQLPSRVVKLMIDGNDMTGQTSLNVAGMSGLVSIELTFNFKPLSFKATPQSLSFNANNVDMLPTKSFELAPQNQGDAMWIIESDVDWLTIDPNSGGGTQIVNATINNHMLPAGTYNGVITVRSPMYDIHLDVPVILTMVVGVEKEPAVEDFAILTSYPNPFNPSTIIELRLPQISLNMNHELKVFDALSREVADLSPAVEPVSTAQHIRFDAGGLGAGMYTLRLSFGRTTLTRSIILLK
jgi:hypothetical protein